MPRRKQPNLEAIADAAQDALASLYAEGYVEEVDAVRLFIVEQGKWFTQQQKFQRDMVNDLSKQLKAAERGGTTDGGE